MEQQPYELPPIESTDAYFYSYQAEAPKDKLQTFAHQGQAPYGYPHGHDPGIVVPNIDIPEGKQPVYHIKVTATPVQIAPGVESPDYIVSAAPSAAASGVPVVSTTQDGTVITHVAPDALAIGRQGFTIKPVQYSRYGQAPGEQAMVRVYAGEEEMTGEMIAKSQAAREPQRMDSLRSGVPGIEQLETGYARQMTKETAAGASSALKQERERIYNWIIPSDAESPQEAAEKKGFFQSVMGKFLKKPGGGPDVGEDEKRRMREAADLFSAASMQMKEYITKEDKEEDEEDSEEKRDEEEKSQMNESLASLLRPSVRYGGVEYAAPEFVGRKTALNYKLHAIEVHQYIPLPAAVEPHFCRNQLDPATTAIFGPMPLPFDPVHSGMVAPTFQKTIENHPAPVLSPEMAKMFNHELPVATTQTRTM